MSQHAMPLVTPENVLPRLPPTNIRVIKFSCMVMGQFCGMVLTDVGADTIKIEPSNSDNIPNLSSSGAGFFDWSNRNKISVAIDLHTPVCWKATHKLIAAAGIVVKNSYPRAILKFGIAYAIAWKLDDQFICVI